MTVIGVFLVALLGFGLIYFTFRIWGLLFVRRTNDLKSLHRYQRVFIWGPIATRKLEAIYSKQLDECTSVEKAEEIYNATRYFSSFCLGERAYKKWEELLKKEKKIEIENAGGDETRLLELLAEVAWHSSLAVRELESLVVETLRPFTVERIWEAVTVKELVDLGGGMANVLSVFSFDEYLDRIDAPLKALYESKVEKVVLMEALATNSYRELNNLCFLCRTQNSVINSLVAMKRSLLELSPQCNQPNLFWTSEPLRKEIDLALKAFLEQNFAVMLSFGANSK